MDSLAQVTVRTDLPHAICVLIVDEDTDARLQLESELGDAGHATDSVHEVQDAIERLRTQAYDLVICRGRPQDTAGHRLVEWIGSRSPSTRVIILCDEVTAALRAQYTPSLNVSLLEGPVDPSQLLEQVETLGARRGFYGNFIEVELFDYVQMIALSGRDKQIRVTTPRGEGKIWFEHGDIIHAIYRETEGEQAFYAILAVGRGNFHEVYFREPPRRTIVGSSTHLLMEAARMMDEGTLGHGQEATRRREDPPSTEFPEDAETSFAGLAEDAEPESVSGSDAGPGESDIFNEAGLHAQGEDLSEISGVLVVPPIPPQPASPSANDVASAPAADASCSGASLLDDPETRALMLGQFFEYEGVNGVAIVSSTGKVLAEDMRSNSALVTLAGFYMRGAARISRNLGYNVFDGIVARSSTGQQMVMVSMGATSAVLSIEIGCDADAVRREVMGVDG